MSLKIFVSSTTEDLHSHREQVSEVIRALGLMDIAMERWPADDHPPLHVVDRAVDESDVYVGIVAWRYGTRVRAGDESYVEHEYTRAGERGIPRLLFLADPEQPWSPKYVDSGEDGEAVRALRSRIEREVVRRYFRRDADLVCRVVEALVASVLNSQTYQALSPERKARLTILRLTREDVVARVRQLGSVDEDPADSGRTWFLADMPRCNVGAFYLQPEHLQQQVANWFLASRTPFLFLVGPSGIGKTNYLINLIDSLARQPSQLAPPAAILLPMGQFNPTYGLLKNLEEFLRQHDASRAIPVSALASLLKNGELLLILDGLDEFARIHAADDVAPVFAELSRHLNAERSRVIVSCRDHIYNRLAGAGLFRDPAQYARITVPPLTSEQVVAALRRRIVRGVEPILAAVLQEPLLGFATHPLLLEMMCRFKIDSWKQLLAAQTKGQLYNLWFEELIAAGVDDVAVLDSESVAQTRAKVRNIAILMMTDRTDVISEEKLAANGIPLQDLQALTHKPFGILVRETKEEWGFVHSSFREFALGETIAAELKSARYELLANQSRLDYVGAEPQQFLRDLFARKEEELYVLLERVLQNRDADVEQWNHLAWNVFEIVGSIGDRLAERFIELGLDILDDRRGRPASRRPKDVAQRNILRCLERLHSSAPRPYCDWVMAHKWPREPDRNNFGALAIRGFHMRQTKPGFFPPLSFVTPNEPRHTPTQTVVSDCLLHLLEGVVDQLERSDGALDVEINATLALIRWLHRDDERRVRKLLPHLSTGSRGNLFHAFSRFRAPEMFEGTGELFRGMVVAWCRIDDPMLPDDFVFREVRFEGYQPWRITVRPDRLVNCTFA